MTVTVDSGSVRQVSERIVDICCPGLNYVTGPAHAVYEPPLAEAILSLQLKQREGLVDAVARIIAGASK